MVNSVDPDQILLAAASAPGPYCLFRPVLIFKANTIMIYLKHA